MFVVYTCTNEHNFIFVSYEIDMKNTTAKKAIAQ